VDHFLVCFCFLVELIICTFLFCKLNITGVKMEKVKQNAITLLLKEKFFQFCQLCHYFWYFASNDQLRVIAKRPACFMDNVNNIMLVSQRTTGLL